MFKSFRIIGLGGVYSELQKVKTLSPTPKGILKRLPALIILKPCSNFLEFTVGVWDSNVAPCFRISLKLGHLGLESRAYVNASRKSHTIS